jgi:hypothetical protein
MRSTGFVGIGTWSPAYKLEVETTGENCAIVAQRTDGATNYMNATDEFANFGSTTNHNLRLVANNGVKMVIEPSGDVGIANTNPNYKLCVGTSGAYCDGGNWVDGSSREFKANIENLTATEAMDTLKGLDPVKFNYKEDLEEQCIGFIAEDVPDLVATNDRKGMSAMDVVAVLTKVVQEQQKTISELKKEITDLKKKLK